MLFHTAYTSNMKVIYAGFSKCGTKTMAQAFKELDLNVYDALEHFEHHKHVYSFIMTSFLFCEYIYFQNYF